MPAPLPAEDEPQPKQDVVENIVAPSPTPSNVNGEPQIESKVNTPVAAGTPGPTLMPPPAEGVKRKGKRSAAALGPDAPPKVRGKPGPKKKARL